MHALPINPRAASLAACLVVSGSAMAGAQVPSAASQAAAAHADSAHFAATVTTLADLVAFPTVRRDGVENARNPAFRAMTAYLERKAAALGLDFADHGAVVVVGLGAGSDRLGLVTHGDVQPADPTKWARDPFTLDSLTEPGRLIGRGTEDDKGPIATALYAMATLKERGIPLRRRIELIISYTEESDWAPFEAFLASHPPPDLNVALDSEYPVVVAEKGWNAVFAAFPPSPPAGDGSRGPRLAAFSGGAFISQIPADAQAVIVQPTPSVRRTLRAAAARDTTVQYQFSDSAGALQIRATGLAAHSSKPEHGRNAITHLARVLGAHRWPDGQAARLVRFVNDLVGTGDLGSQFGSVAVTHPFMGPLTLSLTTLTLRGDSLVAGINIRSPAGRRGAELERLVRDAVGDWQRRSGLASPVVTMITSEPYYLESAPHVPVLLEIFGHYAEAPGARPIAIGGGTHARLMPQGVNFGPTMPHEPYTGHSEHEFISRANHRMNLRMYTAMLVELAGREP